MRSQGDDKAGGTEPPRTETPAPHLLPSQALVGSTPTTQRRAAGPGVFLAQCKNNRTELSDRFR